MQQGFEMIITSALFWLLVLISALLTAILAFLLRRKFRKMPWYDQTLPAWVAINVIVCVAPFGFVFGWTPIAVLAVPFALNGLIQWWEVLDFGAKEHARQEVRGDTPKEVA